jgi:hypothetical protein
MTNLARLRVHIAPVGFEIDRIVLPARQMKADKIWLIRDENPSTEKAGAYITKITADLKKDKIDVHTIGSDRNDVFRILKTVKEIFEKEKSNDLYVNVSSGSKIQAIACMMACMMFKESNAIPYYAEPESYPATSGKQQSNGLKRIVDLPKYQIHRPKPELVQALQIIQEKKGKITKKEMAEIAEKRQIIIVNARDENFEQARFASLDKNIIQPLVEQWKFVEVEKIGRNRWIKITPDGEHAAEFLL